MLIGWLRSEGISVKALNVGSTSGLAAAAEGECDIAAIHLKDLETGEYNRPFLTPPLDLIPGYRRLQGIVHRKGDPRFEGRSFWLAVVQSPLNFRYGPYRRQSHREMNRLGCAKRFTSHCKKNSNHSRRRSTSAFPKATVSRRKPPRRFGRIADATADPKSSKSGNGDLQHLREMTLRSA